MVPTGLIGSQESGRAAGNYSPPPVSVAAEVIVMEITYKMTRLDRQEALRIGLSRMSLGWCFLLLGYPLACTFGLLLMFWAKGYHAQWPLTGPFPWHTFKFILIGPYMGLSTLFAGMLLTWHQTARRTVRIDSLIFTTGSKLGTAKLKWNKVLEILDTGEYLCFRTSHPAVTIIPMSAFPNKEQAYAFAEQAGLYWRRATGRRDPASLNAPGVWPPAPTNVQEPNSNP